MATMRLYPVCCKSAISAETLTSFLTSTYQNAMDIAGRDNDEEPDAEDVKTMVIVSNRSEKLVSASLPPISAGVADSPFIEQSAEECFNILQEIYESTDSEINPAWFVVLDEQSAEDSTVLLVGNVEVDEDDFDDGELEGEEVGIQTVRTSFSQALELLDVLSIGEIGFYEVRDSTEAGDEDAED